MPRVCGGKRRERVFNWGTKERRIGRHAEGGQWQPATTRKGNCARDSTEWSGPQTVATPAAQAQSCDWGESQLRARTRLPQRLMIKRLDLAARITSSKVNCSDTLGCVPACREARRRDRNLFMDDSAAVQYAVAHEGVAGPVLVDRQHACLKSTLSHCLLWRVLTFISKVLLFPRRIRGSELESA